MIMQDLVEPLHRTCRQLEGAEAAGDEAVPRAAGAHPLHLQPPLALPGLLLATALPPSLQGQQLPCAPGTARHPRYAATNPIEPVLTVPF